jgi:hypothetical protein
LNDVKFTIPAEEKKIIEIYNAYKFRRQRLRKKRLALIYEKNLKKKKFFKINKKEEKKVFFVSSSLELNDIQPLKKEIPSLYTSQSPCLIPSFSNLTQKLSEKTNNENVRLESGSTMSDNSPSNLRAPSFSEETLHIYKQIEYFYNLNKVYLNLIRTPTYNYNVTLGQLKEYISLAKNYSNSDLNTI